MESLYNDQSIKPALLLMHLFWQHWRHFFTNVQEMLFWLTYKATDLPHNITTHREPLIGYLIGHHRYSAMFFNFSI